MEYLNANSLLPFLQRERLVTPAECEVLMSDYKTKTEKNQYLLSILPSKGEKAFQRFVKCLDEDKDHSGHADLAALFKSFEDSTFV